MDCDAKDEVFADAKHGFILEKMNRDAFKERYPDATVPGKDINFGQGLAYELWFDKDSVTVAEYFAIRETEKEICLMDDGSVIEKPEAEKLIQEWEEKKNKIRQAMLQTTQMLPQTISPSMPQSVPGQGMPQQQPQQAQTPPQMLPQASQPNMPQAAPPRPPDIQIEPRPEIIKTQKAKIKKVKHWIVTATEILSKTGLDGDDVPGKYIPIIMVNGKTINIEGKTYRRGLIRFSKDPQKLFNYSLTSAAEVVHLAPKTPWIGTAKQFEGYEKDYAIANTDNLPFMKYNPDVVNGQIVPPPSRLTQGDAPIALFAEIERAEGLIKKSIGMGSRDVGQTGPERSGAAVIAAQKPGDVATFVFMDNLSKSIAHCGTVVNEMIPEVYDTERDARLRDVDGTERWVPINTTAEKALENILKDPQRYQGLNLKELRKLINNQGRKAKYNDITEGHYGTVISTGPSYTTQRQESSQNLLSLSQNWPEIKRYAGDLLIKNLDVLGADEIARRLEKALPPGMKRPTPGEPVSPPMPIPPQVQLQMAKVQTEMLKQQNQMAEKQLKIIQAKTALIEQYKEAKEGDSSIRKEILNVLSEIHSMPSPQATNVLQSQATGGGEGMTQ
jgi:hypothetical protein